MRNVSLYFLLVLVLGYGSGCNPTPQPKPDPLSSSSSVPAPTPLASPAPLVSSPVATPTPAPSPAVEPVSVTIYTIDAQCQNLLPMQVQVPGDRPVEGAVGEIIRQQRSADFALAGYRVSQKQGVATIDLRLATTTQRPMTALSSCEQLALFGSLRETLLKNPQWGITSVEFTERGKKIVL